MLCVLSALLRIKTTFVGDGIYSIKIYHNIPEGLSVENQQWWKKTLHSRNGFHPLKSITLFCDELNSTGCQSHCYKLCHLWSVIFLAHQLMFLLMLLTLGTTQLHSNSAQLSTGGKQHKNWSCNHHNNGCGHEVRIKWFLPCTKMQLPQNRIRMCLFFKFRQRSILSFL